MKNGCAVTFAWAVALAGVMALSTQGCDYEPPESGASEIVFGISQSKTTEGKVVTRAGYELLQLGGRGWKTRGFLDRGRSCWIERLDERLGQPRMEGGRASFGGAKLPTSGVLIEANQKEDTIVDGGGWASGDRLRFEARGFAMPQVPTFEFAAPSTELPIVSPDAAAAIALSAGADLTVTWDGSSSSARESVVLSLEVETDDNDRGNEVRCFFDRKRGSGTIPHELIAGLPATGNAAQGSGPRGTFRVATHQQVSLVGPGQWLIYVIADVLQRKQPFTLTH